MPVKYVIVIPDGAADEPLTEHDGRTPLELARTPNMDRLATLGVVGRANHTPAEFPAGSDVANLSLLGYEPARYHTGRAAIEAVAQGIPLADEDWVIRCNLVTIEDQVMTSFTAGQIGSAEAAALLSTAQQQLPPESALRFFPGVSYRNLAVWQGARAPAPFSSDTRTMPPHDLTGQAVLDHFPRGPGSGVLSELMSQSVGWFAGHGVNQQRIAEGKPPATNLWLWGLGRRPSLEPFAVRHGLRGAMITAVDLLRGLARLVGWQVIDVPGATGYTDTDYAAKGRFAIQALEDFDMVTVHIEATDEASHEGDRVGKIKAIEAIDDQIVGPLLDHLAGKGSDWRMLVTPDHPTLLRTKTHTHGDVPFAAAGSGIQPGDWTGYGESSAAASQFAFAKGWLLMDWFVGGSATR
jgi:2,3-bisphosphoglycerate-independent phosphoglycerate mutase